MSIPKEWSELSKINPQRDVPTDNKYRDGSWAEVPSAEEQRKINKEKSRWFK